MSDTPGEKMPPERIWINPSREDAGWVDCSLLPNITANGVEYVRADLTSGVATTASEKPVPQFGSARGKIQMAEDFDAPDDAELAPNPNEQAAPTAELLTLLHDLDWIYDAFLQADTNGAVEGIGNRGAILKKAVLEIPRISRELRARIGESK